MHTEIGVTIRDLARKSGCHASTILRQIRRIEARRDDPLVDKALSKLARAVTRKPPPERLPLATGAIKGSKSEMKPKTANEDRQPSPSELKREGVRILRRLCESGAMLAVAENMEKAVVVRSDDKGATTRTAVVDAPIAEAMALSDWIACANPGRISRYHITPAGRTALSRMLAEQESLLRSARETGFAEEQAGYAPGADDWGGKAAVDAGAKRPRRVRYSLAESPLVALARRKDRDGAPFLNDALVQAGERLREDFELAQMGPRVGQNWERFLTGGARGTFQTEGGAIDGSSRARERVARALNDLGAGLSDVVLRCCCYLEGLETAEKRLGWSARSGKIVLRIALQRLKIYYDNQAEPDRMIG